MLQSSQVIKAKRMLGKPTLTQERLKELIFYPAPGGKFCVQLEHRGKRYRMGGFQCVSDAVKQRCEIERHLFGAFSGVAQNDLEAL